MVQYKIICSFDFDGRKYKTGDKISEETFETLDASMQFYIKKIYNNTYKIPIDEDCTGEVYYLNKYTNYRKEDNKNNDPDFKIVDKSWKPKYGLNGSPVIENGKYLYFIHETDEELNYYDCIKVNGE